MKPTNLFEYYRENPDKFEQRFDQKKKMFNYVCAALCLVLLIFPAIIPIGNWIVRILALGGIIFFGLKAFFGGNDFYSLVSGGVIKDIICKKFARPERNTTLDDPDAQRIIKAFENQDWAALADEPETNDRPLQLNIHEDAAGKTFYIQLEYWFSTSDNRGITDVVVLSGQQYDENYQIIKSMAGAKS
jgi:hypothetical protein